MLFGDWIFCLMKTFGKRTINAFKITAATFTAIFTLLASFTGVYAWFSSNQSVTVSGGTFRVQAPDLSGYELYYLSSFTDDQSASKDGNYNSVTHAYSGYQTEYETATFTRVNFDPSTGIVTDSPDPTNIQHLWPAHKMTFAFVSKDAFEKMSLISWTDAAIVGVPPVTESGNYVRLSWAINIYGKAYSQAATNNKANDIALAFEDYYDDFSSGLTDCFDKSEGDDDVETIDIIEEGDIPSNPSGYETIIFFTIEFSNDPDTFYIYDETNDYYYQDDQADDPGNSNCYIGLQITNMVFSLE